MAKLPYTFTVCPDGPEPQKFTASCAEMGVLLRNSHKSDLTIDQRRHGYWESWTHKPLQAVPFEDRIVSTIEAALKERNA